MAMVPYIGAYNEKEIQDFLDRVLRGSARPSSIKTLPILTSHKDEF